MKTNTRRTYPATFTHGGAVATAATVQSKLVRTVQACMLFENCFYEDGEDIAARIRDLVCLCPLPFVLRLAQDVRHVHGLRHAPLWMLIACLDHPDRHQHSQDISAVIANVAGSRADLPGELLSLYWKDGKRPLAKALRRGLAAAMLTFSSHAMQKYASNGDIRLRDVLFLTHPKPRNKTQAEWFKLLADDKLPPANTWEVRLSSGENKREAFESLLREKQMGALAILRNIRNMRSAGIPIDTISGALTSAVANSKFPIMPYQFIAAAVADPMIEPHIETAMMTSVGKYLRELGAGLQGHTLIMVDTSASMRDTLSAKSSMTRYHAAIALAMLLRETCEVCSIYDYGHDVHPVPPRRGFALLNGIRPPDGRGTYTAESTAYAFKHAQKNISTPINRIVIITDEQSTAGDSRLTNLPLEVSGYVMNVGSYENGIARGKWTTITGFSEQLVKFILAHEGTVRT